CHRVIGKNGSLTGYAGGLEKKEFLLALERQKNESGAIPNSLESKKRF
ncbi:MAG: MGMT family protein, partial [Clostridia bacterium]|nr:MGMT family protein [Clostridia bacterium]